MQVRRVSIASACPDLIDAPAQQLVSYEVMPVDHYLWYWYIHIGLHPFWCMFFYRATSSSNPSHGKTMQPHHVVLISTFVLIHTCPYGQNHRAQRVIDVQPHNISMSSPCLNVGSTTNFLGYHRLYNLCSCTGLSVVGHMDCQTGAIKPQAR